MSNNIPEDLPNLEQIVINNIEDLNDTLNLPEYSHLNFGDRVVVIIGDSPEESVHVVRIVKCGLVEQIINVTDPNFSDFMGASSSDEDDNMSESSDDDDDTIRSINRSNNATTPIPTQGLSFSQIPRQKPTPVTPTRGGKKRKPKTYRRSKKRKNNKTRKGLKK